MLFKLLPVIDVMTSFYQLPLTPDRFQQYLKMLEGGKKGDLLFPISGFNPMAKGHVLDKLNELKAIGAEDVMKDAIKKINWKFAAQYKEKQFNVALNLSDDLRGGWTNRFTSDYDSKFRINGLFERNFCVPVFWSSEPVTKEIVRSRAMEYMLRTIYRIGHSTPVTLEEHFAQENFVADEMEYLESVPTARSPWNEEFYNEHKNSAEYALIFNFLYGDAASESLSFKTFGNDGL